MHGTRIYFRHTHLTNPAGSSRYFTSTCARKTVGQLGAGHRLRYTPSAILIARCSAAFVSGRQSSARLRSSESSTL